MGNKKKFSGFVLLVLMLALPVTILSLPQKTNIEQKASGTQNLNINNKTASTSNPDGSMGPASPTQNFAHTLPEAQLGDLTFYVINQEKTASVTSLQVTIAKAEVHLVHTLTNGASADHWEVLNIGNAHTVDLVALAKSKGFESFGLTRLAGGDYAEVRLYITKAYATVNGTSVPVSIVGNDGIVRIVKPFSVTPSRTTNITIDFNAEASLIKAGDGYQLRPVIGEFIVSK